MGLIRCGWQTTHQQIGTSSVCYDHVWVSQYLLVLRYVESDVRFVASIVYKLFDCKIDRFMLLPISIYIYACIDRYILGLCTCLGHLKNYYVFTRSHIVPLAPASSPFASAALCVIHVHSLSQLCERLPSFFLSGGSTAHNNNDQMILLQTLLC